MLKATSPESMMRRPNRYDVCCGNHFGQDVFGDWVHTPNSNGPNMVTKRGVWKRGCEDRRFRINRFGSGVNVSFVSCHCSRLNFVKGAEESCNMLLFCNRGHRGHPKGVMRVFYARFRALFGPPRLDREVAELLQLSSSLIPRL